MRLTAPVFGDCSDPGKWVARLREKGYTAAAWLAPDAGADLERIDAYAEAARRAGIVIAEAGAWSNPLSEDRAEREAAIEKCKAQLALAERIGARCCVNIAGSRGTPWDSHDPRNLTDETFEMIVRVVREIIDAVAPTRTWYTLETMPWMLPDSTESYARLIEAIDRDRFAVHFDPVNLINSPRRYYDSARLVREFVGRLGTHIRSVHAKDIAFSQELTVHLSEAIPGRGGFDHAALLTALDELDADLPVVLEHCRTEAEYDAGAAHLRSVAGRLGIRLA